MNSTHINPAATLGPKPLGRRERKRQAREQAIVRCALAFVAEGGLEALSLHRIARELDLAVGALYRYFDSKAALIAHLELEVLGALRQRLESTWRNQLEPKTAVDHLISVLEIAEAYRTAMHEHPAWRSLLDGILVERQHLLETEDAKTVMAEVMTLIQFCGLPIVAASDAGVLSPGDPEERIVVFWSAIRGVMQLEKLEEFAPQTLESRALFDATTRTLLAGWGASLDALTQASSTLSGLRLSQRPSPEVAS